MRPIATRYLAIVLVGVVTAGLGGCATDGYYRGGFVYSTPAPSPAYYDYWYYPGVQVYFDINRRMYFYLNNGSWVSVRTLPPYMRAHLGTYVSIRSRYDRPYHDYDAHRRHYPPGQYRVPPGHDDRGRGDAHYKYAPPMKKVPEQYRDERRDERRHERREDRRDERRHERRDDRQDERRHERRDDRQDERRHERREDRRDDRRDERRHDKKEKNRKYNDYREKDSGDSTNRDNRYPSQNQDAPSKY